MRGAYNSGKRVLQRSVCYRGECAVEVIVHEGGIQQWKESATEVSALQRRVCYRGQCATEASVL